jgi:flagellar assembly protein FliH
MRSLSDRILKSQHVSLGSPIKVKAVNHNNGETDSALEKMGSRNPREMANDEVAQQIYSYIIEDANREATRIINEAKAIADGIIHEAFEKAEKERELAKETGKKEGYEAGKKEAEEEYRTLMEEAEKIKADAVNEYSRILESTEEDIVNLVLKTTKKVVGMELKINKEIVLKLVAEALAKCSNRDSLVVRVSRQDYEFAKDNEEEIKKAVEGIGYIELKADPSLTAGSCIVETNYGCVDSGIDTRMKMLEAAFRELLSNRQ